MGKRIRRMRAWMMENAYLVTIGCVLAMVVGCALYTQALREQQAAGIQAAADAPEIRETATPSAVPTVTPLPTIAPLTVRPAALTQRGGAWPVEGEILRAYDVQESVYWEKLGLWRAHMGLDIAGEPGETVGASMDGTVSSTTWDALWGWQVIVAHDGGRETRYAGLESCTVKPGMSVRRGQTIGTLMESIPCEGEMDTHLHLEMRRNGQYQDPEATLPEK
ncbi:MAG: M23 family metallopeptidase [Clostridia bacterium]|nr:M23 family metallopeptidase [Clostridia bacterium]